MKKVTLEQQGRYATLFMNRPDAFNSFDLETVLEMRNAVRLVGCDPDIKVLLVRGKGNHFCTGADLKYFRSIQKDPDALKHFILSINEAFVSLEQLLVPVIAVVHGYCLAGGFELLQACDLAIAATDAVMGDQHANFGLIPGGGGTQRLPRLIGIQRAKELLYTGRWLTGVEAEAYGLILKAVSPTELESEVNRLIEKLVHKSASGLAEMKKVVNCGMNLDMREAIALEVRAFLDYFPTDDPYEGLTAFSERRNPRFR